MYQLGPLLLMRIMHMPMLRYDNITLKNIQTIKKNTIYFIESLWNILLNLN